MIRSGVLIVVATLAFACATPQGLDSNRDGLRDTAVGRYGGELGTSPVGAIPDVRLRDDARNREYLATIEYPTRETNAPLIIFSPAFSRSHREYVGLSSAWASNGYVVVRVSHDDTAPPAAEGERPDYWQSQTVEDWRDRVRDVTFVLDSLDSLEQRYPELVGKIDRTRVGVAGHGYGAFTAMLVGGVRTFPGPVSYVDPRVKAVLMMSPVGPGEVRGLTRESWLELNVPAMFMIGTREAGAVETETPEWRREAFVLSPAGDKWLVMIEQARTGSFTGRIEDVLRVDATPMDLPRDVTNAPPGPWVPQARGRERVSLSEVERTIFNRVKGLSLAFWDLHLKGDEAGREALAQPGGAMVERK